MRQVSQKGGRMSVLTYETCVNCEHWWPCGEYEVGYGFCREAPPRTGRLTHRARWPRTAYDHTCGRWKDAWEKAGTEAGSGATVSDRDSLDLTGA
jgi:hypothetical protein